ncbi:MAG: hypothetical protein COT26_01660 [Candidatus Kerfeldbacteria bacterium CG08_land_8_20_14_0_20_43_14]|uniref:Transposase IS200-like domain-containing protein n=1 Tax=Candidatus Kerfeldbacteria bacterium CG08_land_8_20_14_0_20_43_14 TaxID=2014246 RepID=A0A2H0YQH1_9BACT|nr:MAG: hypothetical protein COT26_01660 [Candidatus Kerfeldbacteria bacterium CG08_land_8_20_14_0_20_43_14]
MIKQNFLFFTTKVRENENFFNDLKYSKLLRDIIINTCKLKGFLVVSFCIMPDHLHLIVWKDPVFLTINPARASIF